MVQNIKAFASLYTRTWTLTMQNFLLCLLFLPKRTIHKLQMTNYNLHLFLSNFLGSAKNHFCLMFVTLHNGFKVRFFQVFICGFFIRPFIRWAWELKQIPTNCMRCKYDKTRKIVQWIKKEKKTTTNINRPTR